MKPLQLMALLSALATAVSLRADIPIPPASLSGYVYHDLNNDGIKQGGEPPIANVTVTLTWAGFDDMFGPDGFGFNDDEMVVTTTDANGFYIFTNLLFGTFMIQETQPTAYLDGKDTQGTPGNGTTVNDAFLNIVLGPGEDGTNNNFGEVKPVCPNDASVECGSSLDPDVNLALGKPTASGSADCSPISFSYTDSAPTPGNCGGNYTFVRAWKATDNCGNMATCLQTITVTDTTAPIINSVPAGGDLLCNPATTPTDESVKAQVTATDGCSGVTVNVMHTDAQSGCSTTRMFSIWAVDGCNNNSATQTDVYTWKVDTTPPVLSGLPSATASYQCLSDVIGAPNVTANDDCDGPVSVSYIENSTGDSCNKTITRTWSAMDRCGNPVSFTQTITVKDTMKPTFTTCPANVDLGCNPANVPDCDLSTVVATDNCGTPTITCSKADTVNGSLHIRTLTYVAEDACGNKATCIRRITWYVCGALGNYVWEDRNANGVQDEPASAGINGVTVKLLDCGGNVIASTTTANDGGGNPGYYLFNNLTQGCYQVQFVPPGGYVFTTPNTSGNAQTDSDANQATGKTVQVNLPEGVTDLSWDAGLYRPAAIGDFVWEDKNVNGVQDGTEPGISGATVWLTDCSGNPVTDINGNPVAPITTGASGAYNFTNLKPGQYQVSVTLPSGYVFTQSFQGADTSKDSNITPATGKSDCRTLVSGQTDNTVDAGAYKSAACMTLTKTVNKTTIAPYESVVYSYLVCNCGGTTLTSIVVKDDNGTPDEPADDFPVGTIASLAPNSCSTLTAQVIPVVSTIAVVNGNTIPAGAVVVVTALANGDIKITYFQDFGINDNTYGTGAIGWGAIGGHKFGDLTGSDKLEFRVFAKDGSVVIDLYVDCISQASSVTLANGSTINYPAGYGTLGPFGGDGFMVAGNPTDVVTFSTSISDNLNNSLNLPKKAALIVNSPTSTNASGDVVIDMTKAPGGWEYINTYSVTIKGSAFVAGSGFGAVAVPDQHNSPNKLNGPHGFVTSAKNSMVTNTATATSGSLTASGQAVVAIVIPPPVPSPWDTKDIGAVAATGSANSSDGIAFTVAGSGNDIGSGKDEFRYVYQPANGNCTIVAKVGSVQKTDNAAKAGVMIRDSLADNSIHAGIFVTAANGIEFRYRTTTGGSTTTKTKAGLLAPYWVKLDRSGNTFTASYSPDNMTWTVLGTQTITMGTAPYIGLGVCAHKDGTLCTATFSNVSVTP